MMVDFMGHLLLHLQQVEMLVTPTQPSAAHYLYNRGEKPSQARTSLGSFLKDEEFEEGDISEYLESLKCN